MVQKNKPSGWDNVAAWYDGWMGKDGSHHHQNFAIPALLNHLELNPGQSLLDIGCGSGVLAPYLAAKGIHYTGVDISPKLIAIAKRNHSKSGKFIVGDARRLSKFFVTTFDACCFLLSIQDMNPLDSVLENAAARLSAGGIIAILMTHPCFRIPRQSGWGYEDGRKLHFRRIDRYLSPLNIPMKQHKQGTTISFHRPLSAYINALSNAGFAVDKMDEITGAIEAESKSERLIQAEIPLFMALRARKI
jgi:SAM-dependent methyltransferase